MIDEFTKFRTRRAALRLLAGAGACSVAGLNVAVAAPESSPWAESSHSAFRLVDGGTASGRPGEHLAGIVVRLQPRFKTYWRHPGDSGVPPVFRFEGSGNLKSAVVHFPAPKRFDDGAGGVSFGYDGSEVVFPVVVTAVDPTKPINLRLQADYAVCEKLCVPASGAADMVLRQGVGSPFADAVRKAMAAVPQPVKPGAPGVLQIIGFRKAAEAEHVLVDVKVPYGVEPELFIEGESPWLFERKAFSPGHNNASGTFLVAVIERNKALDCTGAEVVMTLVAPSGAIEVSTRLDAALVTP
jgi:DsbC/DsbD-like thiol-disulfide interchange protein